jgi:hypothetical protein
MTPPPTIDRILALLEERVRRPVRFDRGTIWIGDWEVMKEVEKAVRDFRDLGENPEEILVGIILDALSERDPTAIRPHNHGKNRMDF